MQLTERKMHRGWAIVAAVVCICSVLHNACSLWQVSERGNMYLYKLLDCLTLASSCISLVIFCCFAVAFFRQNIDGVLVVSLWAWGVTSVIYDGVWFVASRQFSWNVSNLLGFLSPRALLIACCAKEKRARPEKGAKIAATMVLVAMVLESLSCVKFVPGFWQENMITVVQCISAYLLNGVFFYSAFRAIETPKEVSLEDEC